MQDWKMTDKFAGVENAGLEIDGQKCSRKNVEHVVLTYKNHHTKLINVHDLGVSVSSS